MRWPLRYQILFPFASVMLAVVIGLSLVNAYLAARRAERQIAQQLHAVESTLLDGNFPLSDVVLRQMRGLSGAEFLLADGAGQLVGGTLQGVESSAVPLAPAARSQAGLGQPIELEGQHYLHTVVVLPPRGTQPRPLHLHVLYPREDLREALWQAAYPPLIVGAGLLVLVALLATMIAARMTRPLTELRHQLTRLVEGDFQPVTLPRRRDELHDLVATVNVLGDQLDEMRRAIKRADRMALLGQLSGGLAHQLRNSATGARLAMQLHQRHCHDIDQDSLTVALRQLSMIESHLQRFLTAGQSSQPRRAPCDLDQVVRDVILLVAPACGHRDVALHYDGPSGPSCQVSADAEQLRQLLMNLVLNGVEATTAGGWVRIELSHQPGQVSLAVVDSGPGPPENVLQRMFEPFVTGRPEGIGLGLAVAKKIAEAHGGTLRFLRNPATRMEVTLPTTSQERTLPSAYEAAATERAVSRK